MRSHLQEYSITHHVLSIYPLCIYILLLPILGLSESLPNLCHLLFHVLDKLRSNGYSILNPIPTQGCPARASTQGFIVWHTYGRMMPIVIGKFGKVQVFFPLNLVIHHIHS